MEETLVDDISQKLSVISEVEGEYYFSTLFSERSPDLLDLTDCRGRFEAFDKKAIKDNKDGLPDGLKENLLAQIYFLCVQKENYEENVRSKVSDIDRKESPLPSKETVSAYLLAIRNHAFTTASHTTADAEEAKLHLFQLFNHLNDGYNWMRELEIAAKQVFQALGSGVFTALRDIEELRAKTMRTCEDRTKGASTMLQFVDQCFENKSKGLPYLTFQLFTSKPLTRVSNYLRSSWAEELVQNEAHGDHVKFGYYDPDASTKLGKIRVDKPIRELPNFFRDRLFERKYCNWLGDALTKDETAIATWEGQSPAAKFPFPAGERNGVNVGQKMIDDYLQPRMEVRQMVFGAMKLWGQEKILQEQVKDLAFVEYYARIVQEGVEGANVPMRRVLLEISSVVANLDKLRVLVCDLLDLLYLTGSSSVITALLSDFEVVLQQITNSRQRLSTAASVSLALLPNKSRIRQLAINNAMVIVVQDGSLIGKKVKVWQQKGPSISANTGEILRVTKLRDLNGWFRMDYEWGGPRKIPLTKEYKETPRVASGLTMLDFGIAGNLRCEVWSEVCKDDPTRAFMAGMKWWDDTHCINIEANFMELDSSYKYIEHGRQQAPGTKEFKRGKKELSYAQYVKFDRPYDDSPEVVCWITTIDSDKKRDHRLLVRPETIDREGFYFHFCTWGDTELYGAWGEWIAFPKDHKSIRGVHGVMTKPASGRGVFGIRKDNASTETKTWEFGELGDGPQPHFFYALSYVDVDCKHNTRVNVYCKELTKEKAEVVLETWSDSTMYQAGVSMVVLAQD